MSRPNKIGLDYFPFDVDFFQDEKIEAISGEFGIKGEITVIKLLCAVYRNGYFIEWNEMLKMKLLNNLPGISSELLDQIVNRLVKWGFFNEDLFNSVKILTSRGIQLRFQEATIRRKNNAVSNYSLLSAVNVCNNKDNANINYTSTEINADINTQSKVKYNSKETILTDSKEKPIATVVATPPRNLVDIEIRKKYFYRKCAVFVEKYGKEMIREFYDYWTEPNKSGKKLRFEDQKFFDLNRRLATWSNKSFNNNQKDNDPKEKHCDL